MNDDLMKDLVCYGGGAGGGKTHAKMILMSNPEYTLPPVFWVGEASNITDEQIERLNHWGHRNILSVEERKRIYGEERGPHVWGVDHASGPDQTARFMVTPQKVTFAPIDDMIALQELVHDEFYRDLFRQMAKRTMKDEG